MILSLHRTIGHVREVSNNTSTNNQIRTGKGKGKNCCRWNGLYGIQSLKNISFHVFKVLHSKAEPNQVIQDPILCSIGLAKIPVFHEKNEVCYPKASDAFTFKTYKIITSSIQDMACCNTWYVNRRYQICSFQIATTCSKIANGKNWNTRHLRIEYTLWIRILTYQ